MLPTTRSKLYFGYKQLRLTNDSFLIAKSRDFLPQHLYIISDDEIEEGDWVRDSISNIRQADNADLNAQYPKVIATTDTSLLKDYFQQSLNGVACLPQPSQSFIEKYITEYNKGNKIEEVEVEYEPIGNWRHAQFVHTRDIPIIDSNNCISIQSTKDSYTREEVIQLLKKYDEEFVTTKKLSSLCFDKWIEENF